MDRFWRRCRLNLPLGVVGRDADSASHHGIDWMRCGLGGRRGRRARSRAGVSPVQPRSAQNLLFVLWPGRSFVRKALDSAAGAMIDFVLPKQRSLELYLNNRRARVVPSGHFARRGKAAYAFGQSAANLSTTRGGVLLASILPNPVKRSALHPVAPSVLRLAGDLLVRCAQSSVLPICVCWVRKIG